MDTGGRNSRGLAISFHVSENWSQERLPTTYPCVTQTLCIPHTSCDVECSFCMRKNVHCEKQYSMQHGLHKAYVSFGFNGVVNAP